MSGFDPSFGYNSLVNPQPFLAYQHRTPGSTGVNLGGATTGGGEGGWAKWLNRDSFLGNAKTGEIGWGGLALGGAQSLMSGYMGMKQYGMAKQQLSEAKRQFNVNYEAQRKTLNTAMEGRARARHASNPEAYESPGAYMDKHRI